MRVLYKLSTTVVIYVSEENSIIQEDTFFLFT